MKGRLMSKLDIDQNNSLYDEFVKNKQNNCNYVFVNALTGDSSAWNRFIGKRLTDADYGYLSYNFVIKKIQFLTKVSI